MHELQGKTAVVTGASRGIGAEIAKTLAQHGVRVIAAARSVSALESVVSQIKNQGGAATAVACDVANYSEVASVVQAAVDTYGGLDILVNNAGVIEPIARLADSDPAAWTQVVAINLNGVYHGLRAAVPIMEAQGSGVIVNISSGAATSALEGWSHYCATKAAVLSLTRCADKELGDRGIRVVGLSPGTVATEMQVQIKASGINPVSQLDPSVHIPPAWAAQAVAWLCTEAAGDLAGQDFSLKSPEGRARVGLPA